MKTAWIGYLNTPETFWSDAEYLAKLGYKALEGGDILLKNDPQSNLARFWEMGLSVLTIGVDLEALRKGEAAPCIERAKRLRSPNATVFACSVNASFWGQEANYDESMRDIECMEHMAKAFADEGIQLCYHNHFQDFTVSFHGVKFFDLLIHNTEALKIELDTGWAQNAQENPVLLMKRIAPRLGMIHIKDYLKGSARTDGSGFDPVFTSVGTGVLDLSNILKTASELNIEWAVAEQDTMLNLTPLESLTCAYLNMKETGYI